MKEKLTVPVEICRDISLRSHYTKKLLFKRNKLILRAWISQIEGTVTFWYTYNYYIKRKISIIRVELPPTFHLIYESLIFIHISNLMILNYWPINPFPWKYIPRVKCSIPRIISLTELGIVLYTSYRRTNAKPIHSPSK